MFKFLKEKLKSAISKISEGVEKEGKAEERVVEKPIEEEKGFFTKLKDKFIGKDVEKGVADEEKKEFKEKPKIIEHEEKEHAKIKKVRIKEKAYPQAVKKEAQIQKNEEIYS